MIDTKELRIGNIVLIGGKMESVYNIQEDSVNLSYSCGDHMGGGGSDIYDEAKYIDPVLLTTSILKECGFECEIFHEGSRPVYHLNGFYIDYDSLQPIDVGFAISKCEIKYLHQLQNLYFAITGEDLK